MALAGKVDADQMRGSAPPNLVDVAVGILRAANAN
jgi:hypothetical protein